MSGKKQAVLDIGSDVLTLALQDKKCNDNLLFKGQANYDGYQDGEFLDLEGLYNAIQDLIAKARDTAFAEVKEIVVGVPAEFATVVCKTVETTFAKPRKITQRDIDGIFLQGNTYTKHPDYRALNCAPIYYILDNGRRTPEAPIGHTTKGLASFASYILCENSFLEIFDTFAAALKVKFLYTSSLLAQLMFVVPTAMRDEGVILVDCGYISTGVAYAKGDGLLYSMAFSLGDGNIAGDIATCTQIPFDHASELVKKINLNLNPSSTDTYTVNIDTQTYYYPMAVVNEIATLRMQDIAEKIKKIIDYSPYEITPDTKILISGGGLLMAGAKDILQKVTGHSAQFNVCDAIVSLNKPSNCSLVSLLLYQRTKLQSKSSLSLSKIIKAFRSRRNK